MSKNLIVGPDFFGYADAIKNTLNEQYSGDFFLLNERVSNLKIIKILIRINLKPVNFLLSLFLYYQIINLVIKHEIKNVLFINPELIFERHLKALIDKNLRITAYFWDSCENKPKIRSLSKHFARCATFDFRDSEEYKWKRIDLFSETIFRIEANSRKKQVAFVGTAHSDRPKRLAAHLDNFRKNQIDVELYLYSPLKLLHYWKILTNRYYRDLRKYVYHKPLKKSEISKLYARSLFILDLHHKGQTGLTSRTFEALQSAAVVLTENSYIAHVSQISNYIIMDDHTVLDDCWESTISPQQSHYCSIERFCEDLVESGLIQIEEGEDL